MTTPPHCSPPPRSTQTPARGKPCRRGSGRLLAGAPSARRRARSWARAVRSAVLLALPLAVAASGVEAAAVFNGWNAGSASGSSFDWSSDLFGSLGLQDTACVYPTASATCSDTRRPHGTTTPPDLVPFSLIAGQQVQTRVARSIGGPMLASMTADVQAAGDIEGRVTHMRFDQAVSWLSGYGLFTQSDARNLFVFGGVAADTALYYYMEWRIDAEALGAGARMDYSVEINGNDPSLRGAGLVPADLSGSRAGMFTGGILAPQFSFALDTPAGAARSSASGALDIWVTFSSQPVFDLPGAGPGVPEPGTLSLLLAGGMLTAVRARRRGGPKPA